ncbi:MAG: UDP-4-amino-4,6-dideoxy-N-acetyl-beta-L-altrosamine transaminase [Methanoregula sp.]|nr:MAG: UDP-4-amino-4,6-dideoxy-N-acetyl-beta-L-altrosamine transaminase [Methanoregula sp.]
MIPYGHQSIEQDDIDAVVRVLKSDWLTTGPAVDEFEKKLCSYTKGKYAVAVNSGTSALDVAVQALQIPQGSEVISTPFTFAATNNALLYNGLKPVFADIRKDTHNIDPDCIRKKITPKTKAIIFVDFAGHPCDIDQIQEIAQEHDLCLIDDACHALGASYHGKKAGTFADVNVFSFHPVKAITTGEGGAILTDNPDLAERMHLLRSHGKKDFKEQENEEQAWKYDMVLLGKNYRMNDIQAALGISQLAKLDRFIKRRNELASRYNKLLKEISFIDLPEIKEGVIHAWHLYTILLNSVDRDTFFRFMRRNGIGVNVHYIPTYRLTYYQKLLHTNPKKFPVCEDVFHRIITLPLYPGMNEDSLEYVTERIRTFKL